MIGRARGLANLPVCAGLGTEKTGAWPMSTGKVIAPLSLL